MRFVRPTRAWLVCTLLAVPLLLTVMAAANSGHDFSGYFDLSDVKEQGDLVQVTLHLRLFNHSEADARSVIVALFDSAPEMTFRGNFDPLKVWKSQHFVEMSQQFTITKREFREWNGPPAQPNLVILFQDANGRSWQKGAQLSRRPFVPAAQTE